jgi:hypothetical protein
VRLLSQNLLTGSTLVRGKSNLQTEKIADLELRKDSGEQGQGMTIVST